MAGLIDWRIKMENMKPGERISVQDCNSFLVTFSVYDLDGEGHSSPIGRGNCIVAVGVLEDDAFDFIVKYIHKSLELCDRNDLIIDFITDNPRLT